MKKALRITALCLVLIMAVATLASCGGPSGKYSRKDTVAGIEVESYYEFDGDKVSFSVAGVEVSDATYEISDGKIKLTCSPADRIFISTGRRRAVCEYAENGKLLTSASFRVEPNDVYVRITVIDEKGYPANTNAYFTDELFD